MGKNTLYMIIAQALFIASGYGVHIGIGRMLGPQQYGEFGVIMSFVTVIEIFLATGMSDSVTKFTAEFPQYAQAIRRQGIKIEAAGGSLFCLAVLWLAKPIAAALHNDGLAQPLRLAAVFIPLMALYSVFMGSLGGQGKFGKRAVAMSVQSLSKVGAVFALILLGFGVPGAIAAYVPAYGLALITAFGLSKERRAGVGTFSAVRLMTFALPIIIFSGAVALLMNLDMLFVKSLVPDDASAGFYAAAVALTRAPYQIFLAFAMTMLPAISRATSVRDPSRSAEYVRRAVKAILVLLAPVAFFVAGSAADILRLIYSPRYLPAARPLGILIFGITALSLFSLLAAVITGSGRPRVPMAAACALIPLDAVLNLVLIPRYGLAGAAAATTMTCFAGFVGISFYVRRQFSAFLNLGRILQILICASFLYVAPRLWPIAGWGLILYAAALFALYGIVLVALRILGREELSTAKNALQFLARRNP